MKQPPDWQQLAVVFFVIGVGAIAGCAASIRTMADKTSRQAVTSLVIIANALTCSFISLVLWAGLTFVLPERVDTWSEIIIYCVIPAFAAVTSISGVGVTVRFVLRRLFGLEVVVSMRKADEGKAAPKDC